MASKRPGHVRAVPALGEAAEPVAVSLVDAVAGGDYLEILRAQRREIALALPDERGPAKAALHRQLSLISKEIAALEVRVGDAAVVAPLEVEAWDGTGY